ncbi:MAG: HAD-IIA family hydrolase [Acidimicrobiia bacterium]|nr:HAD-IIA family hydrolase [Acidimicrobiia bacterium]
MSALVVDLDGVVYLGDEPIPGARQALERCERSGHEIWFATNSSLRTPEEAADKIRRITGYEAQPQQVVTSAMAAARLAGTLGVTKALVVGGSGVRYAVTTEGIEIVSDPWSADVVVVGLDLDLHYDTVRDATLAIRNGARFIATNLDPSYPMPDGQWPGAGAIVELVRVASGVDPIATGKPDVAMIDLIAERIGSHTDIWMIGDRPSTDLAMAKTAGWRSVLVLTGVVDSAADVPARWTPDLVIDSIADLPDELERLIGQSVDEPAPHH